MTAESPVSRLAFSAVTRITNRMIVWRSSRFGTAATSGDASRRARSPVAAAFRMCISSPMLRANGLYVAYDPGLECMGRVCQVAKVKGSAESATPHMVG
jgi:hypothetical protein